MKTKRCLFLLILTLTWLIAPSAQVCGAINDGIIAIVNDDIITLKDLHEFLSMIYMSVTSTIQDPQEIKKIMDDYQTNGLERLIDEKLKVHYAQKIELKIRPEAVEKRLKEIRTNYASEKEFQDELIAQGMTLNDLRQKLLDQFKAYYAENIEIKEKIVVRPQQVTDYYENNREQFLTPEQISLNSAFFAYGDDQRTAQQNAHAAYEILKDPQKLSEYPQGFSEVAQKFSGTFAQNTFKKGQALPEIEKAVFSLNINDLSPLVALDNGIYIFQVTEKTPPTQSSLPEVKDKIYNFLFQQEYNARREQWLKKLRAEAFVEIKD